EEKKLGINATACSELVFTDCAVPVTNRIGNEGEGYKVALSTLDGGRIGIAAQATGIDAARLLVRKAAWKQDSGGRFSQEAATAKLFASEMATRVTHKAIQIH